MSLLIGVPTETLVGERRIAVVPDVAKKYQGLGAAVLIQKGAGVPAHYRDEAFGDASFADNGDAVFSQAGIVLRVQPPSAAEIALMKPGAVLLGMLQPWSSAERAKQLAERNITAFSPLPKPPAGRALSEGKEAPQAAFPSWCFPAQTKRRTEGIRVPVPLAWGGSSTARVLLRLCPESACQTGPSLELSCPLEAGGCAVRASPVR